MYLKNCFLVLLAIHGSYGIWSVSASRNRSTTSSSLIGSTTTETLTEKNKNDDQHQHQPIDAQKLKLPYPKSSSPAVTVVTQYEHRHLDGSYEFRYVLSDETVRYERGYLSTHQYNKILVVKGYYSYLLPDRRYLTVYYTADQNGYRQDSSSISSHSPHLTRINIETDTKEAVNQSTGVQNSNNGSNL